MTGLRTLVLCCAALALAGCAGPRAVDVQAGNFLPPPNPTDKSRYCDAWYPASAAGAERTTTLSARITAKGDLVDVAVTGSSGNADLDAAAVTCAAHTFVRPAVRDGAPIEIVWTFEVRWRTGAHSFATVKRPPGFPISCAAYFPRDAIAAHETGTTIVAFTIGTDGHVADPAVSRSSGYADLDLAAQDCVLSWRYLPASLDGKPVTFGWRAVVDWRTP